MAKIIHNYFSASMGPPLFISRKMTTMLVGLAIVGVWLTGCKTGAGGESKDEAQNCPGATAAEAEAEYAPGVLKGRVLAPFGELAQASPLPGWLVPAAHAAPLENERTVPKATVRLYRAGPDGERRGKVLREATTDFKGGWCIKLPDGVEPGPNLMLEAKKGDIRLRRSLISPVSTDLYSGTEALTRLLQKEGVDFTQIPRETYLNMESISDTTFDLLDPVELADGDTTEDAVAKIRQSLAKDRRLSEKLAGLPKRD